MNAFAIALTATLAVSTGAPQAGEGLSAAKELYAAAAYEEALAMLTRIDAGNGGLDAGPAVDQYRSLCLYALGRTAEAESTARELLQKAPLFESTDELPPRVEAMFTELRRQLLPSIAKQKYRSAKAAIDSKQFATAESELSQVLRIVEQARRMGVKDESLSDLAMLADGFRDLAHTATNAAAQPAAPDTIAAAQPTASDTAESSAAQPTTATSSAPPATKTYTSNDPEVTGPVTIVQLLPPVPTALVNVVSERQGLLEVRINSEGRVVDAFMRQPVNRAYDAMVVKAAKLWRYKPATKNGVPVPYVKTIALKFSEGT